MRSLLILSFLQHVTCAEVEGDSILLNSHRKVEKKCRDLRMCNNHNAIVKGIKHDIFF